MLNDDSKEILKAGVSIANALSDGFQLGDVLALRDLPAALKGWSEGVNNLKDCLSNDEGREEIQEFVKLEFEIPDDELEDKIEKTIAWLDKTYDLYLTWSE